MRSFRDYLISPNFQTLVNISVGWYLVFASDEDMSTDKSRIAEAYFNRSTKHTNCSETASSMIKI